MNTNVRESGFCFIRVVSREFAARFFPICDHQRSSAAKAFSPSTVNFMA
jgi:hypothetical protein